LRRSNSSERSAPLGIGSGAGAFRAGSGAAGGAALAVVGAVSGASGFVSGFGAVSAAAGGVEPGSAAPYAALTNPADFTASKAVNPTMVIGSNRIRPNTETAISHRLA
jgi:hypothetical protein